MRLKFTDEQRLIVANQHKILARLDPANGEYHETRADHLMRGLEMLYRDYPDLQPVMASADEMLVTEILQLFDYILTSYQRLDHKPAVQPEDLFWPGFHWEKEHDLVDLTRALRDVGRHPQVLRKDRPLNSPHPMAEAYRRMLAIWKTHGGSSHLSRGAIINLLAAAHGHGWYTAYAERNR